MNKTFDCRKRARRWFSRSRYKSYIHASWHKPFIKAIGALMREAYRAGYDNGWADSLDDYPAHLNN